VAYSVNKVIVLGNLGKDPQLRYTQAGKPVVSFSVATSERFGGPEAQERTEWHNVVAWDKLAELSSKLLSKGSKVYVEGRLQTREYTDKEGQRRFTTEIVAREMVFLTGERGGMGRGNQAPHPAEGGGGGGGGGGSGGGGGGYEEGGGGGSRGGGRGGPGGGGGGGGGGGRGGEAPAAPSEEVPYSNEEDIPF
jgi:single-strand DNA-binding protein